MSEFTKFDYLLNAFERASQSAEPAKNGYGEKRRALLDYVADLERRAQPAASEDAKNAERYRYLLLNGTEAEKRIDAAIAASKKEPT